MPRDTSGTADVVATLSQLLLEGQILGFETNFPRVRSVGAAPEVKVWIREQDDLSLARSRRQIVATLSPLLRDLRVKVLPKPMPGPHRG